MLVANPRDLRFTPIGILSQKRIGSPKMRYFTPRARRCAANDRPYGPAPIIATSVSGFILVATRPHRLCIGIDAENKYQSGPRSAPAHPNLSATPRTELPSQSARAA